MPMRRGATRTSRARSAAGTGSEQDADTVENTGGSTSGGPGGAAEGEEDPSQVDENAGSED